MFVALVKLMKMIKQNVQVAKLDILLVKTTIVKVAAVLIVQVVN